MAKRKLKLESGSTASHRPVIELIGPNHPYLWIGDENGRHFGHVDAVKARGLAEAILRATEGEEAASG